MPGISVQYGGIFGWFSFSTDGSFDIQIIPGIFPGKVITVEVGKTS